MRILASSVVALLGLVALVPLPACRAFVVHQRQQTPSAKATPSTTRIAYSYSYSPSDNNNNKANEDDGGLAAYEKALRAAYGQQPKTPVQPSSSSTSYQYQQEQKTENEDWVAKQAEAFLEAVHEDEEIVVRDHPTPEIVQEQVQVLPKASVVSVQPEQPPADTMVDTTSGIVRENDIADDFIALKNDIERYIFAQTAGASLLPPTISEEDDDVMMTVIKNEEEATFTTEAAIATTPSMPAIQQVETPWGLPQPQQQELEAAYLPPQEETMSSSMMNSALAQFAEAIDTPLMEQEIEPNWFGWEESAAVVVKEPVIAAIVDNVVVAVPEEKEEPVIAMEIEQEVVVVPEQTEEPVVAMELEQEVVSVPEQTEELVAALEIEQQEVVAVSPADIDTAPMILDDATEDIWPVYEEPSMDDSVTIVAAATTPEIMMNEAEPVATTLQIQDEEAFAAPLVADYIPQDEEAFTVSPVALEEEEENEQPIIITEEMPVDLSFAFSPPDQLFKDVDDDLTEDIIHDDDLNELVAAIEEFESSDDAEVFLAALESNPIVNEIVSSTEEEYVEPKAPEAFKEAARIVDVSSEEDVHALQATTRPPAHHEDAEPPAVIKFLGNLLTKDLPEQAKKLPEDLKPIANIAGKLWTNTFGKWAESLTHPAVEELERNDAPSEVFYFNLNTQQGDWDPSADDVTKSQMLSKEQGKAWTATIDSRGNFFVHYYDKEEDVPAPQLIATDKSWDKFSNGAGRVYFVNRETGHSQWDEPKGFGLNEQAVRSLNQEIMSKLFAKKESRPIEDDSTEEEEYDSDSSMEFGGKQHRGGAPVGFNLPSFFEKIATNSKKAPATAALQVEEKVYFEPKPPKEDPWWKTSTDYDPKKLRP